MEMDWCSILVRDELRGLSVVSTVQTGSGAHTASHSLSAGSKTAKT